MRGAHSCMSSALANLLAVRIWHIMIMYQSMLAMNEAGTRRYTSTQGSWRLVEHCPEFLPNHAQPRFHSEIL